MRSRSAKSLPKGSLKWNPNSFSKFTWVYLPASSTSLWSVITAAPMGGALLQAYLHLLGTSNFRWALSAAKQAHWACLSNTVCLVCVPALLYLLASSTEKNAIDEDRNQHAPIDVCANRPAPSLTPFSYLSVSTVVFFPDVGRVRGLQEEKVVGLRKDGGVVCFCRRCWDPGAVVFVCNPSTHIFLLCSSGKLALLLP